MILIRGNLSHRWGLAFDPNTQVKKCQELYPLPAFKGSNELYSSYKGWASTAKFDTWSNLQEPTTRVMASSPRVASYHGTSAAKSVCWVWCRALSAYGPLVVFGWYPLVAGLCFLMFFDAFVLHWSDLCIHMQLKRICLLGLQGWTQDKFSGLNCGDERHLRLLSDADLCQLMVHW